MTTHEVTASSSPTPSTSDIEKTSPELETAANEKLPHVAISTDQYVSREDVLAKRGFLGKLRYYEARMDEKMGVESHGPDRILPEEKQPGNPIVMMFMWWSATMNLSCFATGFLGWEFGLALKQSIPITIFASLIGSATTGWCATMGPEMGLRQVAISRFSLGWYGAKIIAFLNVIEQLGWSAVGCITGGLALSAVSDGHVSLALGVVITAVVGLIFSFVGLKGVLTYEQWAWIPFFVVFMILYGFAAPYTDTTTQSELTGATFSGTCLSLFAIVYGSSASWSSIVSDYYVHYPASTPKWKVFAFTTLGIATPTCIGMVLGCCVGSAMGGSKQEWGTVYDDEGLGYLVQTILHPIGFAKFILVILVLSGIGVNCIAIYSAAISIQLFAAPLKAVPRFIWTIVVFAAMLVLAIAGRDKLLVVLENFLSLLGYWNTSFFLILFMEHYIFRGANVANYDLDSWNSPKNLPIGIAGVAAFLMGIVGCILGMVQTWYVGAIAATIGEFGGDVGNQLAFVFTIVTYLPLRMWEKKRFGR